MGDRASLEGSWAADDGSGCTDRLTDGSVRLHLITHSLNIQQVIYSSRPVPSLTLEEVDEIVGSAQRYNQPRGITGRLLVVTSPDGSVLAFMQWIEGPPLAIQACLKRIVSDPRHHSIHVVQDGPAAERSYPEWSMQQEVIPAEQVEAALAAVGMTGHVDAEGVIVVEGEIVNADPPPQATSD